jgi:hypothetical protein
VVIGVAAGGLAHALAAVLLACLLGPECEVHLAAGIPAAPFGAAGMEGWRAGSAAKREGDVGVRGVVRVQMVSS